MDTPRGLLWIFSTSFLKFLLLTSESSLVGESPSTSAQATLRATKERDELLCIKSVDITITEDCSGVLIACLLRVV